MPPAGFDPATPARERPQTHALARLPESAIKLLIMQLHMQYYSQQPTKKKSRRRTTVSVFFIGPAIYVSNK